MGAILLVAVLSTRADGDVTLKELGIKLPEVLGELRYKGRGEFEGEGLGYGVTYANKMCSVTLYVYDRRRKDIPAGKAGRLIEDELKTTARELSALEMKGTIKHLERVDGASFAPKAVLAKFAAAGYTFDIRGGGCKSCVLVTGYRGHFVKIRATQYVVDGKTNDAELHEFLEAVARKVKVPTK
jgi:hypothetical protein